MFYFSSEEGERETITIYQPGIKCYFLHRGGELEIFYFSNDEGARKIIVREFIEVK